MIDGDLGVYHNSFARENSWYMGHWYKWCMVHLGDELWSLETAIFPWWQTYTGNPLFAEHDATGCF